jgi:hypothetical protein
MDTWSVPVESLVQIISYYLHIPVATLPTSVELREVVSNEHKSPDIAVSFTDKTMPGDHSFNKQVVGMDSYRLPCAIRIPLLPSLCA